MASASENTIEIIFKAVDEFTKTLDDVSGKIDGFGKGLSDIADPFADMAKGVLAIEAAFLAVGAAVLKTRADISNETSKMAASFDIPLEKAKELEPAFKKMYAEGFADSIAEGAETVKLAFQKFGDIGTEGIENISEKALALKSVFGVEVSASIASAKTLVTNFGISGDEAMDLITAGFQKGLDGSGDFLESVNEYSTQFSNGGATAEQFFSVLQSGYQEGVLGTDKAADAFKEFRVRIQDGSKTTSDALKAIGIDATDLGSKMSSGSITAAQAFELVLKKLNETKDANTVMQSGVGLLGTQFEDLGTKAALNLSTTTAKMEDFIGKSDELLNKMEKTSPFEKLWKSFTSGVTDLPMFDRFYAEAEETVKKIRGIMPDAFGLIDTSEFENALGKLQDAVENIFGDVDLSTPEGLAAAFQMIVDSGKSLTETTTGIIEVFKPLFDLFLKGIDIYNSLDTETKELIGNIGGIAIPVSTAAGAFGILAKFLGGEGTLLSGITNLGKKLLPLAGPAGLIAAAGAGGYMLGEQIRGISPKIDESVQSFLGMADTVFNFSGTMGKFGETTDEAVKRLAMETMNMRELNEIAKKTKGSIEELSDTKIELKVDTALTDFFSELDAIETEPVKVGLSLEEFQKELKSGLSEFYVTTKEDIEKNHVKIQAAFDPNEDAEKAKEYIDYIQTEISDLQVKLNTESAQKDFVDLQNYVKDLDYDIKSLRSEESFLKIRLLEETDIEKGADIEKRLAEISEGLTLLGAESADLTVTLNQSEYAKTKKEIDSLVTERHLTVLADEDSVANAKGYIAEKIGDHTVITNIFPPKPEQAKKTKEELEKIVPPEKQLQIMAEIDIANIEAQTEKFKAIQETIQSKFEWNAKLNIAEVEANTAILEKSMDNINTMFTESSSLISEAFGLLGNLDFSTAGAVDIFRLVKEQIAEQNDLQKESLELQKEITESQIRLNEAKQKALLLGKPMFEITVDGSGLQTHLESILYSIMQFAQEKATAEGLESLLGA